MCRYLRYTACPRGHFDRYAQVLRNYYFINESWHKICKILKDNKVKKFCTTLLPVFAGDGCKYSIFFPERDPRFWSKRFTGHTVYSRERRMNSLQSIDKNVQRHWGGDIENKQCARPAVRVPAQAWIVSAPKPSTSAFRPTQSTIIWV